MKMETGAWVGVWGFGFSTSAYFQIVTTRLLKYFRRAAVKRTWHMQDSHGQILQVTAPETFQHVPSSLGSGRQPLHRNVQRFRGGLVCKARRLCASLNSRPESDEEEQDGRHTMQVT